MISQLHRSLLCLLLGLSLQACSGIDAWPEDDPVGERGSALTVPSSYLTSVSYSTLRLLGFSYELVGRDLNGVALDGRLLDGHHVVSVSYAGAEADGEPLSRVWLKESVLHGVGAGGSGVSHRGLVGATLQARLDDGRAVRLRVESMEPSADPANRDLQLYLVSYETVGAWVSLCGQDAEGKPVRAIPLAGRWDYREGVAGGGAWIDDPLAFTFACRGYVLAKCAEGGYKPWRSAMVCSKGGGCKKISMAGHHQACTRALRADYCGDGASHTEDGVPINLYDGFGVRTDSDDWNLEAEWTASGASCMVHQRIAGAALSCAAALSQPGCGDPSHFLTGSLLITELQ